MDRISGVVQLTKGVICMQCSFEKDSSCNGQIFHSERGGVQLCDECDFASASLLLLNGKIAKL